MTIEHAYLAKTRYCLFLYVVVSAQWHEIDQLINQSFLQEFFDIQGTGAQLTYRQ